MTEDGIINLDTERGNELGFTSNLYHGYLWKDGNNIIISVIVSLKPGEGNFSKLVQNILDKGYNVQVPTPLGLMEQILTKKGFVEENIWDEKFQDYVELWTLKKSLLDKTLDQQEKELDELYGGVDR